LTLNETHYGPSLPISEDIAETQRCRNCDTIKPLTSYHNDKKNKNGKSTRCSSCARLSTKSWREQNLERSRAKSKELYNLHKDRYLKNSRNNYLKRKYKLSEKDYQQLENLAQGNCTICKTPFGTGRWDKAVVDHCHKTQLVRGLLCRQCNIGLGAFKDNPSYLINAISYLKDSNEQRD